MASFGEYRRLLDHLINSGCFDDPTKIWWDIRPSAKFPTLESRITDVCSTLDDAVGIAGRLPIPGCVFVQIEKK